MCVLLINDYGQTAILLAWSLSPRITLITFERGHLKDNGYLQTLFV